MAANTHDGNVTFTLGLKICILLLFILNCMTETRFLDYFFLIVETFWGHNKNDRYHHFGNLHFVSSETLFIYIRLFSSG